MNKDHYFTKNILRDSISPNIPQSVLITMLCGVIWFVVNRGSQFTVASTHNDFVSEFFYALITPQSLISNFLALGLTLLNTFFVSLINPRFTIIRNRTYLPIIIFLFLMSCWASTHMLHVAHIFLSIFIFMLFYFFNALRNRKASEQAFMAAFLLSICSIAIQPLIFLVPVCWIGLGIFQSLSLRTFLASLFGVLAPWLIYITVFVVWLGAVDINHLIDLRIIHFPDITSYNIVALVYTAIMVILMIIALWGIQSMSHTESVHVRKKMSFLVLMLVAVSILAVLYSGLAQTLLPVIAMLYAFLFSYPLTMKQSSFNSILFTVFIVINLLMVAAGYFI